MSYIWIRFIKGCPESGRGKGSISSQSKDRRKLLHYGVDIYGRYFLEDLGIVFSFKYSISCVVDLFCDYNVTVNFLAL